MPSKSPEQARLMAAAAHTPGGYGGVPQSVGRDFNSADAGTARLHQAMMNHNMRKKSKLKNEKGESAAAERAESPRMRAQEARAGIR